MDGSVNSDRPPAPPSASSAVPGPMQTGRSNRTLSIVIAYSRLPLPMTRADQMTVAHLIAFLAGRGHAVDLFVLDNGEPITPEQRAWLEAHCRSVRIFRHGPLDHVISTLAGLALGRPLQIGWFTNARQIRAVRRALDAADVGYCYYIRSAETMRGAGAPAGGRGRPATFLAMQLSQSLNTRRMARHYRNMRERVLYTVESRLVRGYEARVWRGFTRTVLIGRNDVEEIRAACRERGLAEIDNVVFGPHGVDIRRFSPRGGEEEPFTLVFNGVLRTYTNVDAIIWFAGEAWPLIAAAEPRARLLVVGRDPRPEVRALAQIPGITVTGEVPDPADYIARAAVCINPVRAGAGMQNKLIEFMAMAKAVVATPVANEGIGAAPGEHLVTAEIPREFADAVLALLADPARRRELGRAGREFIERNWTWEAHFLKLEAAMIEALGEEAAAAG